jgi:hypothetical protein
MGKRVRSSPGRRAGPRLIEVQMSGGEGGNWHSRNEWYRPVDAYFGPQNALLTILVLTGLEGVTPPALARR